MPSPSQSPETIGLIGGVGGALPAANIFTPGITAAFAAAGEARKRDEALKQLLALQSSVGFQDVNELDRRVDYMGDFDPRLYGTPEEIQFQQAQDSAEGRAAQLAALRQLAAATDQSAASTGGLARSQALRDAQQFAQGREQAIMQDAARRGQAGGIQESVMRAQAAQAAAERNQMGQLQAAQQAALMQMAGLGQQSQAASQLRGQDQNINFKNADIINAFNTLNTQARNQTNNANVDLRNQAGLRNLNARQQIEGANVDLGLQLQGRADRNAVADYGASTNRTNAIANALTGQGQQYANTFNQAITAGEIGYQNFKDLVSMAGGGAAGGIGGAMKSFGGK